MSFITSPGVIVPPLTAGGVAYGTGSQAKVTSAGTVGQVLTSAGAGVPTWATSAGGSLIFVSSITASAASTVDVTGFSATYDNFQIQIANLIGGNSASLFATLFLNSVEITSGYASSVYTSSAGSTTYIAVAGSIGALTISDDSLGSSPSGFSTIINLFNVNSGLKKSFTSTGIGTYGGSLENAWGFLNTPLSTVTGVRFSGNTGTLTGTFRLYGIKNA